MKTCLVSYCDSKAISKGYCNKHYHRLVRHGDPSSCLNKTHGKSGTTEYVSWQSMKSRCSNPKTSKYNNYGGRGITVCDRWEKSFIDFYEDMGKKPFPKAQIDRIDNDKGYYKENCRWISHTENNRNRSNNKLTLEDVIKIRSCYKSGLYTQEELGNIYNIHKSTIGYITRNQSWIEVHN